MNWEGGKVFISRLPWSVKCVTLVSLVWIFFLIGLKKVLNLTWQNEWEPCVKNWAETGFGYGYWIAWAFLKQGYMSGGKRMALPPTKEAFIENVKRAHFQVYLWRNLNIISHQHWIRRNLDGKKIHATGQWFQPNNQKMLNLSQSTFWKWSGVAARVTPLVAQRSAAVQCQCMVWHAQCSAHASG